MYTIEQQGENARIVARDAATGTELSRASAPPSQPPYNARPLAYRADGKLIVPGSPTLELDGITLEPVRDLPAAQHVSRDGMTLYRVVDGQLAMANSMTGEAFQTTPVRAEQLGVSLTPDAFLTHDLVIAGRQVLHASTGEVAARPAMHQSTYAHPRALAVSGASIDAASGTRALAYFDGVVEIRSADDQLQERFHVTPNVCGRALQVQWNTSETLRIWWAGQDVEVNGEHWTWSKANGLIAPAALRLPAALEGEHRVHTASTSRGLLVGWDNTLSEWRGSAAAWTAVPPARPLVLHSTATYLNERAYAFEGTMRLDGTEYVMRGQAEGSGMEFKPQGVPTSLFWNASLTLNGQPAGSVSGRTRFDTKAQLVRLKVPDGEFRAEVRRPE